ncbi:ABC1-domain-containing protein [Xylariaceae sp. FL0662B]|nr:ABC1-domain-containing protein [Xylariaceae sp. FL0662B]
MRFADILVDLAAVVGASRSVASRHLELRARQVNRYGQTSSVVRSLGEKRDAGAQKASETAPADADTAPGGDERPRDDVPTQAGSSGLESERIEPKETGLSFNSIQRDSPASPLEQKVINENLLRHNPELHPPRIQPDQSAILTQLRKNTEEVGKQNNAEPPLASYSSPVESTSSPSTIGQDEAPPDVDLNVFQTYRRPQRLGGNDGFIGAKRPYAPPPSPSTVGQDGAPPGVDLNVFLTKRASQILGGKNDLMGGKRPKRPPPSPSWFKDFGHEKSRSQQEGPQATTPFVAESAITQAESIAAQSAQSEHATEPIPQAEESKSRSTEQERTQTVNEILPKKGTEGPTVSADPTLSMSSHEPVKSAYTLRESKVPATRLSRLWNYGGLAAGMLGGAISEGFSRGLNGGGQGSVLLSSGNMERLVGKLSRMRGAALKLGQMMSFQDAKMLPAPIQEVLQRVQDRADYMPAWQRDRVLKASLGPEWRELFDEFEEKPIASASIGQVHRATLRSTGEKVAVKIQFPGVADSINSDLDNLSMLLTASNMLPRGLYLNKTIDNARTELSWECDYEREAECSERYRELLADELDVFVVPRIYGEASGKHVLTMEFMEGVGVTRVQSFTQEQKDWIGTQLLRLCLREITEFRFMQTDPNWTNFQYNARTNKLELLDFGASRAYPAAFVRHYVGLLAAASRADRGAVKDLSERLGYLTGHESRAMLDAHVASILTLAEPFLASAPEVYDFHDQTITQRVKALIPVMIRERLSPPPEETYSLHRKLSGAFLLCARLGSRVRCRELFVNALERTGDLAVATL